MKIKIFYAAPTYKLFLVPKKLTLAFIFNSYLAVIPLQ